MNRNRAPSHAALYIAPTDEELWQHAARPWFERVLPVAWRNPLQSLVVVATRSHAISASHQLIAAGKSHLGIQFATPHVLRELLSDGTEETLPSPADLRLLLAIAAEQSLCADDEGERFAAASVARSPDHLLRALERLAFAGWDVETAELRPFWPIIGRFRKLLRACDLQLAGEIDRDLAIDSPRFAHLLITGFDSAHWRHWHLLKAAVRAAESATVLLTEPRDMSPEELCWAGSWEEVIGEAQRVQRARATELLFSEEEMRGRATTGRATFLVGKDAPQQAKAIALCCARWLAQPSCTRIGIAFPRRGALARLTSEVLREFAIPHNDSFAHPAPALFESDEWRAWLALQNSRRIAPLLAFFATLPQDCAALREIDCATLQEVLREAHSEVLIDHLDVLREACMKSNDPVRQQAGGLLSSLIFLPERATAAEFKRHLDSALAQFGWSQHTIELHAHLTKFEAGLAAEFSRTLFLRWLEETASSFSLERAPEGNHPYARVQLLSAHDAAAQQFSHLIFGGSNDGLWPPPASAEFAREREIAAFNENARRLNRRAMQQGGQGEGHTAVQEGRSLYLGPAEQRRIGERRVAALLEAATEEIAFAASLTSEEAPERMWNASEIFTREFSRARGMPLNREAMLELQEATEKWVAESIRLPRGEPVRQTAVAYSARRDPTGKAGEYDFAFRDERPTRVPLLSVSDFEKLVKSPALVWLKKYVGVEAVPSERNLWAASSGRWIHDWLAAIAGGAEHEFVRLPERDEIDARICAAATAQRAQIEQLCAAAGKPLPDWWQSGWRHALFIARALGHKLGEVVDEWNWISTEWRITEPLNVAVAEEAALLLRGRIDLVLSRAQLPAGKLAGDELWIIDYKTGAKQPLKRGRADAESRYPALRKKLIDGSALQLALYAYAARALGARDCAVSLLSPRVRPLSKQLRAADIFAESDIFIELARMQQTGTFGMFGPLRSAWRFLDDYPFATIGVELDIVDQRWQQTHPALAREEEEDQSW